MKAFTKHLVCSQGRKPKVLGYVIASKTKVFRKSKIGKERKILLLQETLQLDENIVF